jgi:hypothetical protein
MCHSNACLSISGMGDASTFVIKGDGQAFAMGDGMGDASTFVIKGDASLATRVSFTWIIGDTQWQHMSPFCHRSGCVSDRNLTEMR